MPQLPIDTTAAIPILQTSQSAPLSSGWLSLSQLRNALARRLGGRTDLDPAELDLAINEAYLEMCDMLDLPELWASASFTLQEGEWIYRVGQHVRVVTALSWDAPEDSWLDSRPLGKTDVTEFRRLPKSQMNGVPRVWAPYGRDLLVVYPTPDEDYEVAAEFWQRPGLLIENTDYPILQQEWTEGILHLARAKAFSALMEYGMAAQSQNEYVAWLRAKPSALAIQQTGQASRFVPVNTQKRKDISRRRY